MGLVGDSGRADRSLSAASKPRIFFPTYGAVTPSIQEEGAEHIFSFFVFLFRHANATTVQRPAKRHQRNDKRNATALSFSFIFVSFSFIFFHFLSFIFSFSFIFFHLFSFRLGGRRSTPLGPLFLFFSSFFFSFFFSVVHTSAASTRYVMGSRVGGSNSIRETVFAQEGARQNVLNPNPET